MGHGCEQTAQHSPACGPDGEGWGEFAGRRGGEPAWWIVIFVPRRWCWEGGARRRARWHWSNLHDSSDADGSGGDDDQGPNKGGLDGWVERYVMGRWTSDSGTAVEASSCDCAFWEGDSDALAPHGVDLEALHRPIGQAGGARKQATCPNTRRCRVLLCNTSIQDPRQTSGGCFFLCGRWCDADELCRRTRQSMLSPSYNYDWSRASSKSFVGSHRPTVPPRRVLYVLCLAHAGRMSAGEAGISSNNGHLQGASHLVAVGLFISPRLGGLAPMSLRPSTDGRNHPVLCVLALLQQPSRECSVASGAEGANIMGARRHACSACVPPLSDGGGVSIEHGAGRSCVGVLVQEQLHPSPAARRCCTSPPLPPPLFAVCKPLSRIATHLYRQTATQSPAARGRRLSWCCISLPSTLH